MPTLIPLLSLLSSLTPTSLACTNILVTPGASADGSTMITYAADSHTLFGFLEHLPAADHAPGSKRPITEWDTGDHLGEIAEAPHTYEVIGNMNEHQVVLGETTFGGREELVDPTATVDYGSLMYIALQRAKTAREAIEVMTSIVAEYGYRSEGESFSVGDANEAWILEMVGRGPGVKGALWVARKLPDGTISAHANHPRIHEIPFKDKKNVLYSPDVVQFARDKGWFKGPDEAFDFADTYAPPDYGAIRACEARVWSVFRRAAPDLALPESMVLGDPNAPDLPLWVTPKSKLAVPDVMALMRDHFEGSSMDLSKGIGAGPFACPYRWRPLDWSVDGKTYMNERSISTQQTGFSFVTQSRSKLPDPIGGVQWFGVDDTYSTVYIPMYAGIQQIPHAFAEGTGSFTEFSWESAFWVFNVVANLAYTRYSDIIQDVQVEQRAFEGGFLARQPEVEAAALALYQQSPALARDYLTRYSAAQTDLVVTRWRSLATELFVKYLDGNVRDEHGAVTHPDWPESWRRAIVADTKDLHLVRPYPNDKPKQAPVSPGGFYHSREELGDLAAAVPADFPFATEKLFVLPGADKCSRPPTCCLAPKVEGDKLVLSVPEPTSPDACGGRGHLVRLPKDEKRPIVLAAPEE